MTHPGKNPGMSGFPTPNEIPADLDGYLVFRFPNNEEIPQLILGALLPLAFSYNYYEWGDVLPDETSLLMEEIIREAPYNLFEEPKVPAPYWEDEADVDDTLPPDEQTWYGYVSDGNFIEDIGVWAVSNFLAATLSEKAAVLYATNQRKIRLAMFDGGLGGVVKVYANEVLVKVIDMLGTGDIREVEVLTGYVDEAVDILTVLDTVAP